MKNIPELDGFNSRLGSTGDRVVSKLKLKQQERRKLDEGGGLRAQNSAGDMRAE